MGRSWASRGGRDHTNAVWDCASWELAAAVWGSTGAVKDCI